MSIDRRSTRSPLTGTALTHYLSTLRKRVDAELVVLGTSQGLVVAWSGDTLQSRRVAAMAPELKAAGEGVQTHRFEFEGDTLFLSIEGAELEPDTFESAVATIRRIWATTHGNGLGLVA